MSGFDIKKKLLVFNMDGRSFMMDYPNADYAATALGWFLKDYGKDAWNTIRGLYGGYNQLNLFQQMEKDKNIDYAKVPNWFLRPFIVRGQNSSGLPALVQSTCLSTARPTLKKFRDTQIILSSDARGGYYVRQETTVAYRPVMIPLDQKGQFDRTSFAEEYPDGTILKMGTLYVDGKPFQPYDLRGELLLMTDFCIDKTVEGQELSWLSWQGQLFLLHNLFRARAEDIPSIVGRL